MNPKENSLAIRKMRLSDMPFLMRLKNEERWNQTEDDWQFFIKGEQNVNLVLENEDKVIGSITGLNYGNQILWIGMMLIDKNFRRRGYSKLLMKSVIESSEHCNSIKLDATPAGGKVYEKIGFCEERKIWRCIIAKVKKQPFKTPLNVRSATKEDLPAIINMDEAIFGVSRKSLLTYLFENSEAMAKVVIEDGKLVGFCLGRKGMYFIQIGPLCAGNNKIAKALIDACLAQLNGKAVVLDLLADNEDLKNYIEQNGFSVQRPLERMYLHSNPISGNSKNYYLIAGPEFG